MAKSDRIIDLSRQGFSPAEILERVDTSKDYVYKVRSNNKDAWQGSEGNGQPGSAGGASAEPRKSPADQAGIDAGTDRSSTNVTNDDPSDLADQGDGADDETAELELDDPEPKEYECGNCDHPVEYLQKRCSECGERLLWSKID